MKPILTSQRMRDAERRTVEEHGIPARILMELAGRACAFVALQHVKAGQRVAVVCGAGNNGGDGLVVARVLHEHGVCVETVVVGQRTHLAGDALANLKPLEAAGGQVDFRPEEQDVFEWMQEHRGTVLCVDAVFGTGLSRPVAGAAAAAVTGMNAGGLGPVLAVDVPSGMAADSGHVLGCCVAAKWTVALGALKPGHVLIPGAELCGEVTLAEIGIPGALLQQGFLGLTWEDARGLHRARSPSSHKGSTGHVGVVGGSPGMAGAAVLACLGALRSGAGRVSLCNRSNGHPASLPVEVTAQAVAPFEEPQVRADAWVVGPGLALDDDGKAWLEAVRNSSRPAVLDAGALSLLAGDLESLKRRKAPTVLTPHPGELGRMLGVSAAAVQEDRVGTAQKAAALGDAVVVLKGAHSVIAAPDGRVAVVLAGHPVLATGGTGDVLAGVVGALLARGLNGWDAACLGVLLHAKAGETLAAQLGPQGVLASEVAHALPGLFAALEAP